MIRRVLLTEIVKSEEGTACKRQGHIGRDCRHRSEKDHQIRPLPTAVQTTFLLTTTFNTVEIHKMGKGSVSGGVRLASFKAKDTLDAVSVSSEGQQIFTTESVEVRGGHFIVNGQNIDGGCLMYQHKHTSDNRDLRQACRPAGGRRNRYFLQTQTRPGESRYTPREPAKNTTTRISKNYEEGIPRFIGGVLQPQRGHSKVRLLASLSMKPSRTAPRCISLLEMCPNFRHALIL